MVNNRLTIVVKQLVLLFSFQLQTFFLTKANYNRIFIGSAMIFACFSYIASGPHYNHYKKKSIFDVFWVK